MIGGHRIINFFLPILKASWNEWCFTIFIETRRISTVDGNGAAPLGRRVSFSDVQALYISKEGRKGNFSAMIIRTVSNIRGPSPVLNTCRGVIDNTNLQPALRECGNQEIVYVNICNAPNNFSIKDLSNKLEQRVVSIFSFSVFRLVSH